MMLRALSLLLLVAAAAAAAQGKAKELAEAPAPMQAIVQEEVSSKVRGGVGQASMARSACLGRRARASAHRAILPACVQPRGRRRGARLNQAAAPPAFPPLPRRFPPLPARCRRAEGRQEVECDGLRHRQGHRSRLRPHLM